MTEVIRSWPDALFYYSAASTTNVREQMIKLQRAAKLLRALSDAATVDSNGDTLQDVLVAISLGSLSQRHKLRVRYDSTNDRLSFQRNTGTDAAKVYTELAYIDSSGNLTTTGSISTDSLTTTAGGITLGGVLNANDFYLRNVKKIHGQTRTDSLVVHGASTLTGSITTAGNLTATGNVSAGGALAGGDTTITGTLSVSGASTLTGAITVQGADVFDVQYNEKTVAQSITGGVLTDVTSMTAITLPNTAATLTSRKFIINFNLQIQETGGSNNLVAARVYNGSSGTSADTLVYGSNLTVLANAVGQSVCGGPYRLTPGASDRTKVGLAISSIGNCSVLSGVMTIQEVP